MKTFGKFATALLLTLSCGQITAGELEDILAKNYEVRGGLEKIQKVQTYKVTGKLVVNGGAMELTMVRLMKRPSKMRMSMQMQAMDMVIGYDGDDAWMVNPMMGSPDAQDMPEGQRKMMVSEMDMDGHLVDHKKKGSTLEYKGKVDVEGTECFKIEVTTKDERVRTYFLDTESYIEIKIIADAMDPMGNPYIAHTYLSDYQEVDGLMIPFTITIKGADDTVQYEMIAETVELDVDVEDDVFTRPKPAPAPKQEEAEKKDGN